MGRISREKSRTDTYHVILRGINRQEIFNDNEDRIVFKQKLKRIIDEDSNISIYSYCLMSNHVHLLMKDANLPITMRKICSSYVYWYNKKYSRCGHLYQDRYKSQKVEDEGYFITVLRYIHRNPVKAGMANSVGDYKWSSYNEYLSNKYIVDSEFVFSLISKEQFVELNNSILKNDENDECFEYDAFYEDSEAAEIIRNICEIKNINELGLMCKSKRENLIGLIKRSSKLSIRQIARVTGINYSAVRNIIIKSYCSHGGNTDAD